MKSSPLFLVLLALMAAPLRLGAMEGREEKKTEEASSSDSTARNSKEKAAQAAKDLAARGTGNEEEVSDDNAPGETGLESKAAINHLGDDSSSATPSQEKSVIGTRAKINLTPAILTHKSEQGYQLTNYWHEELVLDKAPSMSMTPTSRSVSPSERVFRALDASAVVTPSHKATSLEGLKMTQEVPVARTLSMKHSSGEASKGAASAHMNSSKIGASRESLPLAISFLEASAALSSTRAGQPEAGHNVTQVEQQENPLLKKSDSPESVTFRISETKAATAKDALLALRSISFDPSLSEEEVKSSETTSLSTKKRGASNTISDQEFKQNIRRLKRLVTDLEIKSDDIAENDPERFEKVAALNAAAHLEIKPVIQKLLVLAPEKAEERSLRIATIYASANPEVKEALLSLLSSIAQDDTLREEGDSLLPSIKLVEVHFIIAEVRAGVNQISEEDSELSSKVAMAYAAAYPEVKEKFQSLLLAIDRGEIQQTKSAALALGAIAIQVVEVAFKSIDVTKIEPIKVQEGINDPVMTARQVPWRNVPFEEVKADDIDRTIIIYKADSTIKNLREMIKSLNLSDADIGNALRNNHIKMAERIAWVANKKVSSLCAKRSYLYDIDQEEAIAALAEVKEELIVASAYYDQCLEVVTAAKKAAPFTDPITARTRAIDDIWAVTETVLKTGDDLFRY